ncbi:MAG: hypothetical protein HY681_04430 [Chloroflexi bacterium]|nr:hypothetical protein [Chloroflexota bacterium]
MKSSTRICIPICLISMLYAIRGETQFTIGVWQPGGHIGPGTDPASYTAGLQIDRSFTSADAADLADLGIDLLLDSTPREDNVSPADHTQDFEEVVRPLWQISGQKWVAFFEPEGHTYGRTLERYAGTTEIINPVVGGSLDSAIQDLIGRWASSPYSASSFFGYRIGHEKAPIGQGIYDPATYPNLITVIQRIRAFDTTRRIIAIGNPTARSGTDFPPSEHGSFRQAFFRPVSENPSAPATLFSGHS